MMRSTKFFSLTAAVATLALVAACATDATGPSEEVEAGVVSTVSLAQQGLLRCIPRPYASASALIGPLGGEIKVGKNEFKVPRGALFVPTLITMQLPSDTVNSVRFSPEGLVFNPLALPDLKLDYKNCLLPKGAKPRVVFTTETLRVLESLPSTSDSTTGLVDARLKHFSRYAITY
jgi:hypothetical protein